MFIHVQSSYPSGKSKNSWVDAIPDAQARDCSAFKSSRKGNPSPDVWLGFFSSWTKSWVTTASDWDNQDWHCWTVATIRSPNGTPEGRHMIIWDCDPREVDSTQRRKSILLGMQMKFLEYAKGKGPILLVWYNQPPMDDESDQRPITL
jgi:hypothetical protein